MKTRSWLCSSGSICVRREVPSSTFSHIRGYQTLDNLVPTLRVPRHLGISRAAVIRLPYIIGTISWSSRRSSCHATHTVQNTPLFCSSRSRKLATLGKCHMVGMSFVLFGFTWVYLELLLFLFSSIHFVCLKIFVNYCNSTENLSPKSASQYKSELSNDRLLVW